MVVRAGKYGPYVNWGKVNATLPKSKAADSITLEEALVLIAEKAGKTPAKGKAKAPAKAKTTKAKTEKAKSDETKTAKPKAKAAAKPKAATKAKKA